VLAFDVATVPDLLRLLAVPVLGWAAVRDVRTRRVPNRTWYPLVAVGALALALDATTLPHRGSDLFALRVALSLGVVVPLSYLTWRLGGFGGADAKALMALAVVFPVFPTVYLPATPLFDATTLPLVSTTLGVFSMTVLTNAVLAGALYPLALGAGNLLAGRVSRLAVVGWPVAVDDVEEAHGRLLETEAGYTRDGLDLDALRMYLRWRDRSLSELRADPTLRDPATLPAEPADPTDGAVRTDGGAAPEAATDPEATGETTDLEDPWGAAAFLADVDHHAYGTTPEQLRAGLDLLVARQRVWVSPGIPFLLPVFVGLLLGVTYGDVLFGLLALVGLP
jgi:preflagellin peptidase FlaK